MPTKCCWVIYGRLTSERKASTSLSSFINHSTMLLDRALKRQAPLLYMHFEHSTGSERVDAKGRRAVEVIICMITRDFRVISMTSQASLSLSLSLPFTKVTHAQYRKRFRASYNYSPSFVSVVGGSGVIRLRSNKKNSVQSQASDAHERRC